MTTDPTGVVPIEITDDTPTGVRKLAERVAEAHGRKAVQGDRAVLNEYLSDKELTAEREAAEWRRAQARKLDQADLRDQVAAARAASADARWHRRAMTAADRAASPHARLAMVFRRAEWTSRALVGVVVLGMIWAGVNVQHNLVPSGDMSDPLYWLSFGIEAMISIPIIVIMVTATTATRIGAEVERGKIVFFEIALLTVTVALNCGPHVSAGRWGTAAEYAIAPVMVGVAIWLHAWTAQRYAHMIERVTAEVAEADHTATVAHSVRVDESVPTVSPVLPALGTGSAPVATPYQPAPPVPATPANSMGATSAGPSTAPILGTAIPSPAPTTATPAPAAPVAPVPVQAPAASPAPAAARANTSVPVTPATSGPAAPVSPVTSAATAGSAPAGRSAAVPFGPILAALVSASRPAPAPSASSAPAATAAAVAAGTGPGGPVRTTPVPPVPAAPAPVPAAPVPTAGPVPAKAPAAGPAGHSAALLALAEAVQATGAGSRKSTATVADIIAKHDAGMSVNAIEGAGLASHKIVSNVVTAARELRSGGGGAQVITLRK